MKKIMYLFLFLPSIFFGQEGVRELEIDLKNYEYPYEVHILKLNVQQQNLDFAFMDIEPKQHNGKMFCCCTEKTSMVPTGKQP